jgi:hypothetical protein
MSVTPPSPNSNVENPPVSIVPQPLQNLSQISLYKLTRDNYPLWCTIIVPFLEGQNLYGYVNGDISSPPRLVASSSSTSTSAALDANLPNPAYPLWYQQDKIVLTALISSLSENILVHVYGLHTSRDVWLALEKMFASQSKARVLQSRLQLTTLKKGPMSIPDYFQKAQALSQSLAIIDEPLKDSELISYILAGLGPEYDSLVTTVSTRIDPITIDDLYGYLLTHEQRLEHFHSAGDSSILTANVAQRNNSNAGKYQRNSSPHSGQSFGRSRGRGRGRGSQSFFQHSSNRPVCQICNRVGHVASKCYNRFDHSYQCEPTNPAAFLTTQNSQPDLNWYPDTGSTNHLTNNLSNLNMRAEEYHGTDQIKVGNGQGLDILHTGLAQLPTSQRNFSLPNLLHVPRIEKNLISVNQFTHDNQVFIEFHPYFFRVKDLHSGSLLLQGPSRRGLYPWPSSSSFPTTRTALIGERVSIDQWHNRLGHPATPLVRRILSKHRLPVVSHKSALLCPACQQGKLHKLHFGVSLSVFKDPMDLLYLDVWGPAPILSSNNKRYFLCIVDDFSKYFWLFPLAYKSDVLTVFTQFKVMVEIFFGRSIKSIQTDGGGEFIALQKFLSTHGISHRKTCPHTHHQNGSVERKHRQIVDTGLSLLAHSHVPFAHWDSAFETACFLINRLPSSVNRNSSPFELLFHKVPDYKFLKVFGCECWPYLRPYNSHKFAFRSKSCIFIGYSTSHHGYKCLDRTTNRVYIARHVLFNEQVFPYQNLQSSTSGAATTPITSSGLLHLPNQHLSTFGTSTRPDTSPRAGTFAALVPPHPYVSTSHVSQTIHAPMCPQAATLAPSSSSVRTNPSNTPPFVDPPNNTPPFIDPPNISSFGTSTRAGTFAALVPPHPYVRSTSHVSRTILAPMCPQAATLAPSPSSVRTNPSNTPPFVNPPNISSPHLSTSSSSDVSHLISPPSCHPMVTRSQNHIRKPTLLPNGTPKYPLPHALTVSTDCPDVEPTCYSSTIKHAVWRDAMAEEFNALLKNGTWTLVSPTPSMNIVGSKWVYRIKRKADGSVDRYKARLVAKGFHQQEGVDFWETYSPVIKPITIRTVLSIAVSSGWAIKQVDVSNAFLHGLLNETVYMSQPVGFVYPQLPNAVCLLKKALYGLKQAPRAWFSRLSTRLLELGFIASKADTSLFVFISASVHLFALVYVDDIIFTV